MQSSRNLRRPWMILRLERRVSQRHRLPVCDRLWDSREERCRRVFSQRPRGRRGGDVGPGPGSRPVRAQRRPRRGLRVPQGRQPVWLEAGAPRSLILVPNQTGPKRSVLTPWHMCDVAGIEVVDVVWTAALTPFREAIALLSKRDVNGTRSAACALLIKERANEPDQEIACGFCHRFSGSFRICSGSVCNDPPDCRIL